MMKFRGIAAASTVHLPLPGRGRNASLDAFRVRGLALSWNLKALTRRYAPTSPRRGEVRGADTPPQTISIRPQETI
jgi:hypothetical protein